MRARRSALPLLFLALVLALPASAQQKKSGADLNEKERALQQAQKRLKEERAKAAEVRKREAGILSELETIDRRLNDKRKQVALLDGRIKRTQAEMGDLQHDIARLENMRGGQEDAMARRLRAMYRLQVQGGALDKQFILVAHYKPLVPRSKIKDKMKEQVGGKLRSFNQGDVHKMKLTADLKAIWKGALVDEYAATDRESIRYWCLQVDPA